MKPEKKEDTGISEGIAAVVVQSFRSGYNQACDEWEKHLPSEEEIGKIIIDMDLEQRKISPNHDATFYEIAEAIYNRIHGEGG